MPDRSPPMTETPDELRARLGTHATGEHNPAPWDCNWDPGVQSFVVTDANREQIMWDDLGDFAERVVALVNAWPDIDALLARLTAAKAEAAEHEEAKLAAYAALDTAEARLTAAEAIVQRAETIIVGHGLEGDEHAYRTLQMILALRERPS